jgi:hypothetical protein
VFLLKDNTLVRLKLYRIRAGYVVKSVVTPEAFDRLRRDGLPIDYTLTSVEAAPCNVLGDFEPSGQKMRWGQLTKRDYTRSPAASYIGKVVSQKGTSCLDPT